MAVGVGMIKMSQKAHYLLEIGLLGALLAFSFTLGAYAKTVDDLKDDKNRVEKILPRLDRRLMRIETKLHIDQGEDKDSDYAD